MQHTSGEHSQNIRYVFPNIAGWRKHINSIGRIRGFAMDSVDSVNTIYTSRKFLGKEQRNINSAS